MLSSSLSFHSLSTLIDSIKTAASLSILTLLIFLEAMWASLKILSIRVMPSDESSSSSTAVQNSMNIFHSKVEFMTSLCSSLSSTIFLKMSSFSSIPFWTTQKLHMKSLPFAMTLISLSFQKRQGVIRSLLTSRSLSKSLMRIGTSAISIVNVDQFLYENALN